MKIIQVCCVCYLVFKCFKDGVEYNCEDCRHQCNDNELCDVEHSICDDCRDDFAV